MSAPSAAVATRLPRNSIVRNLTYLLGGQLTTWLLAAVWTVVVPRQIGPTGTGQLVTVWSAIGLLTIVASLGTKVMLVTDIARDPSDAGLKVAAASVARVALLVPCGALMAAYLYFAHFSRYQDLLLVIATAALPMVLVSDVLNSAFQGLERMQYIAYLDVIYKSVTMIGGIVLVLLGFRVLGLILLGFGAAAIVFGISIFWASRHFDLTLRIDSAEVSRVVIKGLPFWATTMINTVYLWIDSILLALLASPTEVGWYGVPTKLFAALLFVPVIISTATLARLSTTFTQGPEQFRRALTPIVEWTLLVSFPLAAGTAALAGPALGLLYGPAYAASGEVLMILALCIPATYLNIVVNQSLVASNRQMLWTKVMAVSAVVNIALNLVAIPAARDHLRNGALGAAGSLLVTELVMGAAGLYLLRKSLDSRALARVGRTAGAAAIMGAVTAASAPLGLAVQLCVSVATFTCLALPLRLISTQELELVRGYAGRRWTRWAGARSGS